MVVPVGRIGRQAARVASPSAADDLGSKVKLALALSSYLAYYVDRTSRIVPEYKKMLL